jgi:hypothetical protein
MDNRLDCEARIADHYQRTAAEVAAEGWKTPPRIPRYRVTIAQILVGLAARVAPTVTLPSPTTRVLAQ